MRESKSIHADVAYYLELLRTRALLITRRAVERKDEKMLRLACNKVKVPENIRPAIIKALLRERMFYE